MLLWFSLGLGLELSSFGDLRGELRLPLEPLLAGRAMVLEVRTLEELSTRPVLPLDARWSERGIQQWTLLCTDMAWDSPQLLALRQTSSPESVLVCRREQLGSLSTSTLFLTRSGLLLAGASTRESALSQLAESAKGDSAPIRAQLLAGPWRDEREGWILEFRQTDAELHYRAEEMTRWDRPTAPAAVAEGTVSIAPPLVRLGQWTFWFDPRAGNLLDPADASHRLVPAARPRLPVLDGAAIDDPAAIRAALVSEDALLRREAAYHGLRGLQRMELSPELAPWSVIADSDPWTSATGVFAAGECGRVELLARIEQLLDSPHAIVRRESVRALGKLGWKAEHPRLRSLASQDLDPLVRHLAANPPAPPPPPPDFGSEDKADPEPR